MALETNGLILTGFMGAGKSTVGKQAAKELDIPHYDTDVWIRNSGVDVESLVIGDMAEFRRIEAEALETILGQEPGIISTGGGIVSTEVGRNALEAAQASVVLLQVPFERLAERAKNDKKNLRPLFANIEFARKLFNERQQWYEETSDYKIDASGLIRVVVRQVVEIAIAA